MEIVKFERRLSEETAGNRDGTSPPPYKAPIGRNGCEHGILPVDQAQRGRGGHPQMSGRSIGEPDDLVVEIRRPYHQLGAACRESTEKMPGDFPERGLGHRMDRRPSAFVLYGVEHGRSRGRRGRAQAASANVACPQHFA
jgi:hypothetical protein